MAVPKLRFKEFNEDWKENSLKNCVASIDSGWSPLCESNPSEIDEWGVLKTTAVDWDGFKSDFNKKLPLQLSPRLEIEVKPLDILVTRAGPTERVGVVSVVPMTVRPKLMISDKLIRLKVNEQTDASFLGITLSSAKCQSQLQSKTSGLAKSQTNISQKILSDVLLMLPPKTEQTKIASFLSAVDEKISQLNQKHGLLCQYKQGMMQKLFSQQFRFKADDGREFGEWEEKKITDMADYVDYRGKTPKKVEDGILLVTAKNIRFGYIDYDVSQEYICSDDFDEVMRRGLAEIGDVLITTEAPLGNVASVDRENIALAQRVIKYRGKKGILNNEFLKQKFLSKEFQSLISSKATGGTVQGIKGSTLHNLEIQIPQDIAEQTKIANLLSAIDQKIEVVAQQIEQAKIWKKGLLQQMFV